MKTAVQKNVVHLPPRVCDGDLGAGIEEDADAMPEYYCDMCSTWALLNFDRFIIWYAVNRSEMLINIVVNIRFKSKKSAEQTSCITLYFG